MLSFRVIYQSRIQGEKKKKTNFNISPSGDKGEDTESQVSRQPEQRGPPETKGINYERGGRELKKKTKFHHNLKQTGRLVESHSSLYQGVVGSHR